MSSCAGAAPQTACDAFYFYPAIAAGGAPSLKTGSDEQNLPAAQPLLKAGGDEHTLPAGPQLLKSGGAEQNLPAGPQLLKAGGDEQNLPAGQPFVPVRVRVADKSVPPNSVSGIAVRFHIAVFRDQVSASPQPAGEAITGQRSQPVAVSISDVTVYSDGSGQASYTPQTAASWGAVRIDIQASIAGGQTVSFTLHTLAAAAERTQIDEPHATRAAKFRGR